MLGQKAELNKAIAALVMDFQVRTDLLVKDISFRLVRGDSSPRPVYPEVEISLYIESVSFP